MNAEFTEPLDECIDNAIQSCPMDYRRKLYNNIVLSGGSTLFDGFDKKLKKDPPTEKVEMTAPIISIQFFKNESQVDKIRRLYVCVIGKERLRVRKLFDDEEENLDIGKTLNLNCSNNHEYETQAIMMDMQNELCK